LAIAAEHDREKQFPNQLPETLGRGRRTLFRVVAVVVVPLLLISGLEAALRVAGYGYATTFFKPLRIGTEDYLVENDKFGWRFFPPEISRSPTPLRMLAHKPPGTFRIFLFGESAALGDPEPAFGAGRYLQRLLQERYPEMRFEVVCAAMTAINSHAVLPIARECAALQGDLWIIYMGNNEMIGPFGAVTVFGSQSPPLWYVRLTLAVEKTRVGQLFASLGRRLTERAGKHGPSWGGMQMFLKNQIAPGDPRKEKVYYSFQRNLEDILRSGRAAHVPMILSTVAVNLKDCAPFGSLTSTNPGASGEQFERLHAQAVESQGRGNFAEAARGFEQAAGLDPNYAELQFRWGQCLLGLTNAATAKAHFMQARDDDALPFRTDSRINTIISQAGARSAGRDLTLFDAVSLMAGNSPTGIPGDEAFYEHVHFNFAGNYLLARALADAVAPSLPLRIKQQMAETWASQETCEKDLGLTDWNRRDVYENMSRRLVQPPFTGQAANAQKARAWEQSVEEFHRQLNATNVEPARRIYLEAIGHWPDDFRLHVNYAAFLEAIQDLAGAQAEWNKVQTLLPHHYLAYFQIGRLLAQQDKTDEARNCLSRALEMRPDLSEGWYELGRLQGASGQFEAALGSFERARRLVPGEPRYRCEMAKALVKLNRGPEAIAQLEEAIRLGAVNWEAHYLLGEQLAFANRIPEARQEFEQTLKLKPAYVMAHLNLGVALVKEGQLEDARRQFEEVLRLEPDNQLARNALSQISDRHP
jgi:tetratricopeptide (TPR) repeat protein